MFFNDIAIDFLRIEFFGIVFDIFSYRKTKRKKNV